VFFVTGFFAALAAAISQDYSLPRYLGIPPQAFYISVIAAYYITTMINRTEAYELYFDETRIYSKLETGKLPPPAMVIELIEEQLAAKKTQVEALKGNNKNKNADKNSKKNAGDNNNKKKK
jgi:hypothetical protein